MLGRVIIIDGVDGSGKSTLADAIRKEAERRGFKTCYVHCTYRKNMNVLHHQTTQMWEALRAADQGAVAVIDRLWPSEAIYAAHYRGGSKWPLLGRLMDRVLLKYCAAYVITVPNPEGHAMLFEKLRRARREMYQKVEPIRELFHQLAYGNLAHTDNNTYADYWMKSGGMLRESNRCMAYDMHAEAPHNAAIRALDMADKLFYEQAPAWRDPANMVLGHSRYAKYLIVGETVNMKAKYMGLPKWPFYEHGNSSLYLANAMQKLRVSESDFAYVNAFDVPLEFLRSLWELACLHPIALGAKAYARLVEAGIPEQDIVRLNHPQWERRFNQYGIYGATMDVRLSEALKHINRK